MVSFEKGQIIEEFKNHEQGIQFNIADNGATILVFFDEPTDEEVQQFKAGNDFEIRALEMYDVIMLTVKIGNLNWMDAPYNIHLSKNLTTLQPINHNKGLGLTLVLIDASTGEIKHIRLMTLSERFSKELFRMVRTQKEKIFNKQVYAMNINYIFGSYSTRELVKMSSVYCRLN